jgi:hypothetical protein
MENGAPLAKRGPNSASGRAAVRLNAVQHGILATTPVIPELESEEEWAAHYAGFRQSCEPANYREEDLVHRLATISWRLRQAFE